MSKTDLRIRPFYHRLKHRTEAHICNHLRHIVYTKNWKVYCLSLKKAEELTHNMYQFPYMLPESKEQITTAENG